jgi:hypothetical protein
MSAARSVTAHFVLSEYSLTTNVVGSGYITLDNPGPYHYGDMVHITAVPATGWSFTSWSGDLGGNVNPTVISINSNKSVTATFTINTYPLTVTKAGTGSGTVTSSPDGINCGVTCSYSFNYNTVVTLSATPTSPSIFMGWSGAGCSGKGTCMVALIDAESVTASFTNIFFLPFVSR